MPPTRDIVFPLADYSDGEHVWIERTIPGNVQTISFEIRRATSADPTIWPNTSTIVQVQLLRSFDGGQMYEPAGAFTSSGGIFVSDRTGQELAVTFGQFLIPTGGSRKVKGSVIVTGGPLRTEMTFLFE